MSQEQFAGGIKAVENQRRQNFEAMTATARFKFKAPAEYLSELEKWFDHVMDRVSERFALRARWASISFAVIRLKTASGEAPKLGIPPEFFSAAAGRDWIRAQIGDSARAEILIGEYNKLLNTVLREKIGRLVNVADSIRVAFDRARFTFIPKPYPKWPYGWRELIGMIVSSVLLSLGASFWYNVLKHLANLRPRVADIIGREKRESKPPEA